MTIEDAHRRDNGDSPHPRIAVVIAEAVKAGIFRRAQRLSPQAKVWGELGDMHSANVTRLLRQIAAELDQ